MRTENVEQVTTNQTINLALDTLKRRKQALVFVNTKKSAERMAEDIALKIKTKTPEWEELSDKALHALPQPTKQCRRLALCLKHGVAFHHAGLHQSQKRLIEDAFRESVIGIIACTPTLAAGVDLPAFRTIIRDVKRYAGSWGMSYIPVLEYLQMAGRAGRPGKEDKGEAILIAPGKPEQDELYEKYILGEPEDITSKLAVEPVLRTYVLSLIASGFVDSRGRLLEFFSKTFWAHQYGDLDRLDMIIEKVVNMLEDFEFIRPGNEKKSDFIDASEIKDFKIKATLLGRRVAQLYIDPLTAHELMEGMRNAKAIKTFPVLQLIASTLEMRPALRVKTREFEDIQESLARYEDELLCNIPSLFNPEYEQFLNTVKTALFMNDWIDETDEETLLEKYDIRPGETRVKLDTADWILYAMEELATLMSFKRLLAGLSRIRFRLRYGVREELLPLLKLKNIGRVRARKMFNNKIRTLGDVKKVDFGTLAKLIGQRVAADVKEQMGQKVDVKIPKGRRKGQISLNKF